MAATIGGLLGLVFGTALLGAVVAWLIRKISPMPIRRSYAVGVAIGTIPYLLLSDNLYEAGGSTAAGIAIGVLCGLLGFGLLCLTSRRARNEPGV